MILIVSISLIGLGMWFVVSELIVKRDVQPTTLQPQRNSQDYVLEQLREIILLPTAEQPEISQILDAAAAKRQNSEFYLHAQDGDYLFVFEKELKTAIIFRLAEKKIIAIVPLGE
jgi:hypothetical protein